MSSANPMSLPAIRNLLDILAAAIKKFSMSSLEKQLATAVDLLRENPPIDVAVLGQFKAGKSSFLNSLIGHDVLPVGAIPVTTAITRLQYGERERALVRHFNGRTTVVERHFIKGVPKEVEINLSRLAYQWEKSVNNAIDAMRIQATSYMHEELATIEALLSRTQGRTDDIKRVITQMEKLSGTLPE